MIEIADHVLLSRPTAGIQGNPLSGKVRQEPGRVEAEVVIARAPRNRRCRCAVQNEGFDAMLVIEFACDSQTRGPRADDNGVGTVLGFCRHPRSPVVCCGAEDFGPRIDTIQSRVRFTRPPPGCPAVLLLGAAITAAAAAVDTWRTSA